VQLLNINRNFQKAMQHIVSYLEQFDSTSMQAKACVLCFVHSAIYVYMHVYGHLLSPVVLRWWQAHAHI